MIYFTSSSLMVIKFCPQAFASIINAIINNVERKKILTGVRIRLILVDIANMPSIAAV